MSIRKFLFSLLLVCSALVLIYRLFTRALAKRTSAKPVSKGVAYDAIDAYVDEQMHRLKIPGVSLAIVEGDQIVHMRGFGKARPGGDAPAPQTPFIIGSLSKSFTALAVMQLAETGQIELDAPVQKYLPWFQVADPQASAQITVRHLLNQTSGLPTLAGEIQLANFDDHPDAAERQARALSALKLTRRVGSKFEYSNANYNLLGLVIEAASGESYADYIQKHIFNPLGMNHSYTSQAIAKQNGLAVGHRYWFANPFAVSDMPVPQGSLATGQLISSAEDMARYMIALLNGGRYGELQILSEAGIAELHHGVAEFSQMGVSFGKYGMGWFVDECGSTKMVWHNGTTPDFGSFMALLPDQNKGMILLFNANHHWMVPVLSDFGGGVAAMLAGEQPDPVPFTVIFPWLLRAQLLIPLLQIVGVGATLQLMRCWQLDPNRRLYGGRDWMRRFLLPLIANILAAFMLRPMLGKRRGYLRLYMPDYALIARVSGNFSLVWSILHIGLVLKALRGRESLGVL